LRRPGFITTTSVVERIVTTSRWFSPPMAGAADRVLHQGGTNESDSHQSYPPSRNPVGRAVRRRGVHGHGRKNPRQEIAGHVHIRPSSPTRRSPVTTATRRLARVPTRYYSESRRSLVCDERSSPPVPFRHSLALRPVRHAELLPQALDGRLLDDWGHASLRYSALCRNQDRARNPGRKDQLGNGDEQRFDSDLTSGGSSPLIEAAFA